MSPEEERHFRRASVQHGAYGVYLGTFTGAIYDNTYVEVLIPAKNASFRCLPILPVGYSSMITKEWASNIGESHVFAVSFAYGSLSVPLIVGVVPRPKGAVISKTGEGKISSMHAQKSSIDQNHETGDVILSNKSEDEENPTKVNVLKGRVEIGKTNSKKQEVALAQETIKVISELVDKIIVGTHIDPQTGTPSVIASPAHIQSMQLLKQKLDSIKSKETFVS